MYATIRSLLHIAILTGLLTAHSCIGCCSYLGGAPRSATSAASAGGQP